MVWLPEHQCPLVCSEGHHAGTCYHSIQAEPWASGHVMGVMSDHDHDTDLYISECSSQSSNVVDVRCWFHWLIHTHTLIQCCYTLFFSSFHFIPFCSCLSSCWTMWHCDTWLWHVTSMWHQLLVCCESQVDEHVAFTLTLHLRCCCYKILSGGDCWSIQAENADRRLSPGCRRPEQSCACHYHWPFVLVFICVSSRFEVGVNCLHGLLIAWTLICIK